MPEANKTPMLSPHFALALQFANQIHSTQARKGLGAPYISHLMAVCALVLEYGGNEQQAIAALLHDAAEDCGGKPMLDAVQVMFGDKVASIVNSCTDTFETPKPEWEQRKKIYLNNLCSKSAETKLVACADKLHNLSNTIRDIGADGASLWKVRMSKTPNGSADKQLWYFRGCRDALAKGWDHPLMDEFSRAVAKFESLTLDGNQT